MANGNYSVLVAKKTFSPATGDFIAQAPIINTTLAMQSNELKFAFDGFAMKITYSPGQNSQVEYILTQAGHPLNGNFAVAFGVIILDPGQGGATTFRQLEIEVNVSLTEKYRITLNKT